MSLEFPGIISLQIQVTTKEYLLAFHSIHYDNSINNNGNYFIIIIIIFAIIIIVTIIIIVIIISNIIIKQC